MTAKTMQKETDEAMDEMRESASKILNSIVSMSKTIDWKSVIPKVIVGMVVIYGLRNRKLLSSLVTSVAVGMMSEEFTGKIGDAFKTLKTAA